MVVHNHGPEEGPGLKCKEQLVGNCMRISDQTIVSGGRDLIEVVRDYLTNLDAQAMARKTSALGIPSEWQRERHQSLLEELREAVAKT